MKPYQNISRIKCIKCHGSELFYCCDKTGRDKSREERSWLMVSEGCLCSSLYMIERTLLWGRNEWASAAGHTTVRKQQWWELERASGNILIMTQYQWPTSSRQASTSWFSDSQNSTSAEEQTNYTRPVGNISCFNFNMFSIN